MPVYNEADAIETLILDLERELPPLVGDFEAIVVDDASTDETPAILERLAAGRPWLDVRRAAANAGHGPAVVRGLDAARADWIFQTDSDGQFVVADVALLWSRREDADLVLGVRAHRLDPAHRLALSRVVRAVASVLAGRPLRDVNTPFRLVRRSLWEELRPLVGAGTLAPNIHVSLGAAVARRRVHEVPVRHLPRGRGTSTLRALRLLRFSMRGLGQLLRFRLRLARTRARGATTGGRRR